MFVYPSVGHFTVTTCKRDRAEVRFCLCLSLWWAVISNLSLYFCQQERSGFSYMDLQRNMHFSPLQDEASCTVGGSDPLPVLLFSVCPLSVVSTPAAASSCSGRLSSDNSPWQKHGARQRVSNTSEVQTHRPAHWMMGQFQIFLFPLLSATSWSTWRGSSTNLRKTWRPRSFSCIILRCTTTMETTCWTAWSWPLLLHMYTKR